MCARFVDKPITCTEDLRAFYDYLYSRKNIRHEKKGNVPIYGLSAHRNKFFIRWIQKNIPTNCKILDTSCGRGLLLKQLLSLGYTASGTEISTWLIENDLKDLNVINIAYDELHKIESASFDCVISNDVLEHLLTKEDVIVAIRDLVRISSRFLCFSVGIGGRNTLYPRALRLHHIKLLHFVKKSAKWWQNTFNKWINIDVAVISPKEAPGSAFFFGTKK